MNANGSVVERVALAVAGIVIGIPGLRLLFGAEGYVEGKDNLTVTPDLFSELSALGAIFLATAAVMLAGTVIPRLRSSARLVGIVAFLPQGIARLISYGLNEGQHESYLRAGILETIIGIALTVLAVKRINHEPASA